MKKRAFIFSIFLILSFCMLAFAIHADSIYSDFTKPGANGEAPIFSFLGYSVTENGDISSTYKIDSEALSSYEKKTGIDLSYKMVVTHKNAFSGTTPLDSNGNVLEESKNFTLVVDFGNQRPETIFSRLSGLSNTQKSLQLVMCLFVIHPTDGVIYIGEEATKVGPESISYTDILNGTPATPAAPVLTEVTINGMTYSINGETAKAADRIKQQNASNADYNSGSSLSSSELTGFLGVKTKAQLIAAGGSMINMPAASALMSHYLKNTGETYNIDVKSFLTDDSGALKSRNTAINNALRAAEQLAQNGRAVTINQLAEGHPMQGSLATQNWQYAIGSYFDDVDVINLTVTEVDGVKTYTADIKYIVTDFYNWDTNDYNKFKNIVSPHDLHELHKAGLAKEFMSYGEITYSSITWTEGQTVDQISGLN